MKILHISPYAELGGCEFNALTIAQEIDAKHSVLLFNNGEGPFVEKWKNAGADVQAINILKLPFYLWKTKIKKALNSKAFDLCIYWSHMHLPLVLSAINAHSKQVLVHIGNPIQFTKKQKVLRALQSVIYPFNAAKVELRPVSEYVRQSLKNTAVYKHFTSKVSYKPIVVDDFEKTSVSSPFSIAMMARMDAIKDFETPIYAFAKMLKSTPDCRLYLAGNGEEKAKLQALVEALGLTKNVRFLGRVDDKSAFFKTLDVFVYATTLSEGLAGVVGEAIVSGIPTICADLPMLREWDAEEKCIQFFEAKNAAALAELLIKSKENYATVLAKSQMNKSHFAERFAPKNFAENYINVH